ncbi:MAG: tyrosine-type recombinase/integrase [Paracoccaceae bacterium]
MLTDLKARKMKSGDRPQSVGGVPGLSLHSKSTKGTGKFILRFVSPETGKRRDMGLGSYPETGIAQARKLGFEARELIAQNIDPIEHRRRTTAQQQEVDETPSFEKAAIQVFNDIAPGFKNAKHRDQWINTLRTYVFPELGRRPVDGLSTADFALVLRPIWLSKPETASRVRQRCERVMMWCVARELAPTNPVSAVNALLPKQKTKRDRVTHQPSVPWRDMPDLFTRLFDAQRLTAGKHALLFTILTASRSGEVRNATWDEIDLDKRVWTIPAQRMKAGVQHRVPLSNQCYDILKKRAEFSFNTEWIFSNSGTKPISNMTLTKVLRDNMIASDTPRRLATAHGFRSSFRNWASEKCYPRDCAERALAHTIANETEAAYHRTDLLEQRRPIMQAWADFVTKPLSAAEQDNRSKPLDSWAS